MTTASLIAAQTRDGFIARDEGESSMSWTSPEDKKRFVELTKRAKVMVMGRKTFNTIGRGLPGRTIIIYTRHSLPRAYDGVETTTLPPGELLRSLEARGFSEVAICGGAEIYDLFLRAGVVDKLYLTIEPLSFGTGIPLFKDPVAIERDFTLLQEDMVGGGTLFRDLVRKHS